MDTISPAPRGHGHVFLARSHEASERRTWAVIWLCGAMMVVEIVGGLMFGSIALVADGLHMSTHAGALLLAAFAYTYARRHADDPRFTFGTGKLGDLAGFASAVILAMIAVLIGYEAVGRFFAPVGIAFGEAIPIAFLGLAVNVASAWLLGGGHHHHEHGHGHGHGHGSHAGEGSHGIETASGTIVLDILEEGCPPRFRLRYDRADVAGDVAIETVRSDGRRQVFAMVPRGDHLESIDAIPEPHAFVAHVRLGDGAHSVAFDDHHEHAASHRDNNMRAALVHVLADAAVSVLVILGLVLARTFGWMWMDPLAGLVGALVIASWSRGLIRDTGAIMLDMNPEPKLTERLRRTIEDDGDTVADLHVWRLGPGHLGAIVSIDTAKAREPGDYRDRLAIFPSLSHLTIEVTHRA